MDLIRQLCRVERVIVQLIQSAGEGLPLGVGMKRERDPDYHFQRGGKFDLLHLFFHVHDLSLGCLAWSEFARTCASP